MTENCHHTMKSVLEIGQACNPKNHLLPFTAVLDIKYKMNTASCDDFCALQSSKYTVVPFCNSCAFRVGSAHTYKVIPQLFFS